MRNGDGKVDEGFIPTSDALSSVLSDYPSLRAMARAMDENPGTLLYMMRGEKRKYSLRAENRVRRKLGLPVLWRFEKAPVCPHCGKVHVLPDCGGKKPDGLRPVRRGNQRPGMVTPSRVPAELNEIRRRLGLSWIQVIVAGLNAHGADLGPDTPDG